LRTVGASAVCNATPADRAALCNRDTTDAGTCTSGMPLRSSAPCIAPAAASPSAVGAEKTACIGLTHSPPRAAVCNSGCSSIERYRV
jgi:hypothetical protein